MQSFCKGVKGVEDETAKLFNWRDLFFISLGIILIYALLGWLTLWASGWIANKQVLLYANGFATQFAFLLLIISLGKWRGWTRERLGWRKIEMGKAWGSLVRWYLLTWPINLIYSLIVYFYGITPPTTDVYTQLMGHVTPLTFLLNLLLAGVMAPVIEETLFRGIVFAGLKSYFGKWTAAVLSALLFSGLHLQLIGFFPRFVLGIILVHLYDKYQSLYPSMAFHALNNLVAAILMAAVTR